MEAILEKPERIRELGGALLETLERFPEGCREGMEIGEHLELKDLENLRPRLILVAGMGGSAIGGLLLRDWLLDSKTPLYVSAGYQLPGFIDDETLVIAVSYSGNTEETLSAFEEASRRGCPLLAVTSDGRLKRLSDERGIPLISLPVGLKPRASLPQQLFSIATALRRMGVKAPWEELEEAIRVLEELRPKLGPETPPEENEAKHLAIELRGFIPFIYAPRRFEAVAYRLRTQLNENSKLPACSAVLPEAFHNAVMGREGPKELLRLLAAIIIRDPWEISRLRHRVDAFRELLRERFGKLLEFWAIGRGLLTRMLSALYIGDYISLYLSLLYGFDPSSTASIELLKRVK
jgi:glucose/mannose-6-phosphate isomerase